MKKAIILIFLVLLLGYSEKVKKEYYSNGKLKSEMRYKNGKLEGMTKGYYESGKLKAGAILKMINFYRHLVMMKMGINLNVQSSIK